MPKLSINVACYNVENYISRCLESLTSQTLSEIEINCIENGSSDRTIEIIDRFKRHYPNVNLHRNLSNVNLSGSRKNGLLVSTAEYAMLIDADDWLEPDACQILYNSITETGVDVVEYRCNVVDDGGTLVSTPEPYCPIVEGELHGADIFQALLENRIGQMTWNKIYRTDLARKAYLHYTGEGFFHKEDVLFSNIFYRLSKSYFGINENLYNYRIGSGESHSIDFLGRLRNAEICTAITNAYYNMGALSNSESTLVMKKIRKWINDASPGVVSPRMNDLAEIDHYKGAFISAWGGVNLRNLLKASDPYALQIGKFWLIEFLKCIGGMQIDKHDASDLNLLKMAIEKDEKFSGEHQNLAQLLGGANLEIST